MKTFRTSWFWVGLLFGILLGVPNYIIFYLKFEEGQLHEVLMILAQSYDEISKDLIRNILILINLLAEIVKLPNLDFREEWRDVSVILALYLSSHVAHGAVGGVPRPWRTTIIRLLSAVFGIVLSCWLVSVALSLGAEYNGYLFSYLCLIGFLGYRVGFSLQFALDQWQFNDKSFVRVTAIKIFGGVAFATLAVFVILGADFIDLGSFHVVVLVTILFAGFHLTLGVRKMLSDWAKGLLVNATGHFLIGARIIAVVLFVVIAVVAGASP